MKKLLCLFSLLMVLTCLCAGCGLYVKQPAVTVHSLDVVSLNAAGLGMELYLTVHNPNSYDIKLMGYDYDVKVMALPLAKGSAHDQIVFPAGADTDLRIPVTVSYGDLLEIFKRGPDPDRIPYTLKAQLDLDTPLRRVTVPVTKSGTYAVPRQYRPGAFLNRLGDFLRQNR